MVLQPNLLSAAAVELLLGTSTFDRVPDRSLGLRPRRWRGTSRMPPSSGCGEAPARPDRGNRSRKRARRSDHPRSSRRRPGPDRAWCSRSAHRGAARLRAPLGDRNAPNVGGRSGLMLPVTRCGGHPAPRPAPGPVRRPRRGARPSDGVHRDGPARRWSGSCEGCDAGCCATRRIEARAGSRLDRVSPIVARCGGWRLLGNFFRHTAANTSGSK